MKTVGSNINAGLTLKALAHPIALTPRPAPGIVSSAGLTQFNSRNYHHDTDSNGRKNQQICGSGVYIDNREVPTTSLPSPLTVTPAAARKRRRVEPPLLVKKAMLPAPALFNAFGNREMQRCVSPASVVPMACHAINHNCQAQGSSVYTPATSSALNTFNYTVSASPAMSSGEDVGCREAALALTSLWCPQTTPASTQPLTPSVSTIQSYNHASSASAQDPPCLRWRKPVKPLD